MRWYSIRAVYSHGSDSDGLGVFEERIMLYRTEDIERAFALAQTESEQYLQLNPTFQRVGHWAAFAIGSREGDLNEAEIWSELLKSELSPEQFYEQRYTAVELEPDGDDETR